LIPYIRRKRILDEFEKKDIIYVEELSEILSDISVSTIRRDLKTLAEEGQIVLLRGGAAKLKEGSYDVPIETKKLMYTQQKEMIAKQAASLVKDGETIYIDSGTTTGLMIKYLADRQITVITSNTQLMSQIADTKFSCIVVGGEIIKHLGSVVGPLTDVMISNMYFDKAFVGASGYSELNGINTPDFRESNKKRLVNENSKITYVLADNSKAGKSTLCKAFDINECIIITDKINEILEKYDNYIVASL
jgi:DeoR family fructose operon transcriptional repressor